MIHYRVYTLHWSTNYILIQLHGNRYPLRVITLIFFNLECTRDEHCSCPQGMIGKCRDDDIFERNCECQQLTGMFPFIFKLVVALPWLRLCIRSNLLFKFNEESLINPMKEIYRPLESKVILILIHIITTVHLIDSHII